MIDPREVAAIADELTDKAHALVRTIVKNIIEHPTEAKYRQVNPAVIKKRCEDPDVVIKCAKVLSFLGFHGTQVAADNGTHASKNDEEGRANADADQKNEEDAQRLEIEVDDETLERLRRLLRLMPPRASEAERVRAPEAPAAAQRQSSYAALETTGALGYRFVCFPRGMQELIDAPLVTQMIASGSTHGVARRGDDKRVQLTVCNFTKTTMTAHWVTHKREEKPDANLTLEPFSKATVDTWAGHAFVIRDRNTRAVIGGVRPIIRPAPDGHCVLFVFPSGTIEPEAGLADLIREVISEVRTDTRDAPEPHQGRAPAPPPISSRPRRGPFG
eukprot:GEMP01025402.1.p1 GENE.GEMP01025402.1~~GEMP01025402.1.p1  ORF type:complete len:331 (+),score=67.23 GEMP01025402.1:313-1305(+)